MSDKLFTATRRTMLGAALALPLAGPALAASPDDDAHERQLREDFPWLGRYADDNAKVRASGVKVHTVFMGDSITEGWRNQRPAFFPPSRICRGISGQTTPQMVLRMMADVVALRPHAVHIMGGTNDIAGNTGPMTEAMTQDNIAMMTAIAHDAGIKVILASIPPAHDFPWRPGLDTMTPIASLNRWIAAFAKKRGAIWVDYHPALAGPDGGMKPGLASDGVHPTAEGYAAMEAVLTPVLARV